MNRNVMVAIQVVQKVLAVARVLFDQHQIVQKMQITQRPVQHHIHHQIFQLAHLFIRGHIYCLIYTRMVRFFISDMYKCSPFSKYSLQHGGQTLSIILKIIYLFSLFFELHLTAASSGLYQPHLSLLHNPAAAAAAMNHSNLNFNFINAQLALAAQHPAFFGHYSGHPSMSPLHALKGNNGSNSLPSSSSNNRFAPYNLPSGLGSAFDAVTPSKSAPRSLSTSPRPQSSWWVISQHFIWFYLPPWICLSPNHWAWKTRNRIQICNWN